MFRPVGAWDGVAGLAEHDAVVKLVDRILVARRANPAADTSAWEREIDERGYRLYGLTKEEINLVEEGAK